MRETSLGRSEEVDVDKLCPGTFVAHPVFTVVQGDKHRACGDLILSGWNATYWAAESPQLPSCEDPMAYATELLEASPVAVPLISVAGEDNACSNYATRDPNAMVMLVFL